jgi:hypothetical protein
MVKKCGSRKKPDVVARKVKAERLSPGSVKEDALKKKT